MRLWQIVLLALISFIEIAASPAPAETAPEVITGAPEPQSFDVFAGSASEDTANRGMIGGGGYYHATITVAPRYEVPGDGTVKVILDAQAVTAEVHQRQDPGGLALLTWSFDLSDMESPADLVQRVTAHFDGDVTVVSDQVGAQTYVFEIPEGSTALESFDVDWVWLNNQHQVAFKGFEAAGGGWLPWLLLLGGGGLAAYLFTRFRRPGAAKPPEDDEDDDKEKDSYTVDAQGRAEYSFAGPGQSSVVVRYDEGRGLTVHGQFDSEGDNRWTGSFVALDTEAGTATHEFLSLHIDHTIATDPKLPAPTLAGVEAYLRLLVLQNAVTLTDDLPGQDSNRARAPIIMTAVSRDPHPGQTVELRGMFGKDAPLEVTFHGSAAAAAAQQPQAVPIRHVAEVLSDTENRLVVRIPQGIEGKFEILVKRGTLTSEPRKFKVYPTGEMPSFTDEVGEQLIDTVAAAGLPSGAFRELFRLGHVLTRKEGTFRYLLGSKTAEVVHDGRRQSMRWLVVLDGDLEKRLKEATFTIGVALVGSGESEKLLDGDDSVAQRFVNLIQVDVGKEEGDKVYKVQLFPDAEELAGALGIEWNQDDKTLNLTRLLTFDLPENGVKLFFDTEAKQVQLEIERAGRALQLRAGEGGATFMSRERETRVVDGYEQRFEKTQRLVDDKLHTELTATFALREGGTVDDADNRFRTSLNFMDHGRANEAPIVDFGVDADVSLEGHLRSTLAAKVQANRLTELGTTLILSKDKDSLGADYRYVRSTDPALPGGESHSFGLAAQTELLDGDIEMAVRGRGTIERDRGNVRAIELVGTLEMELKKSLKMRFGLEGTYRREFGRDPLESLRILAYGEKEILKTDLRLGVAYSRDSNKDALSVIFGLDASSTAERILKLLKQEKEQEFRLFDQGWKR